MRLEFIDKVKEGDILGKSIFTNEGQVLLRKGIKLTTNYIKKLKSLEVYYMYIQDERLKDVDIEDAKLNELKIDAVKVMTKVVKFVNGGKIIDLKGASEVVENMIYNMVNLEYINNGLMDIKTYDNYIFVHSIDVATMAMFMGLDLKLKKSDIIDLGLAALLHDIGMVNISKIELKNDSSKIKEHPTLGQIILMKNYKINEKVIRGVLEHHERCDGSGYPQSLKGNEISILGKILGVCDSYDRLISLKNSKLVKANEAYNIILSKGAMSFDSDVIKSFRRTFSVYPLGSCVRLSNGIEGYVIKQNKGYPDRPIIRVVYDSITKEALPFYEIDLLKVLNLTVNEIIY